MPTTLLVICHFVSFVKIERQLGNWTNYGDCTGTGKNNTCGPGLQTQNRRCADGTIDKCTKDVTEQTISCEDAGTALPECGYLGNWTNFGDCMATGVNKTCGPGFQKQNRNCTEGIFQTCTGVGTGRTISCEYAGTALPNCSGE